jgi:hypothetical protein
MTLTYNQNTMTFTYNQNTMTTKKNSIQIKAYTLTGLAKVYNISSRSFRRWLLPHKAVIGDRVGNYFTPLQVRLIIESLGLPGKPKD